MNILLTSPRTPVCADIAKAISNQGHNIILADSQDKTIARFGDYSFIYALYTAPRVNFQKFKTEIINIVNQYNISRIIPISEEIFWLAQIPEISNILFTSDINTLSSLHNKFDFSILADELGYGAKSNYKLSNMNDLHLFTKNHNISDFVFKPIYSRFGANTIIKPKQLTSLDFSQGDWIAQKFIEGIEYSVYNIANKGNITLSLAYEPKYKINNGASLYFKPYHNELILDFSKAIAKKTNFTGQLSFDVILNNNKLVAIECNPRATSAIHLISHLESFQNALCDDANLSYSGVNIDDTSQLPPKTIKPAFIFYNLLNMLNKSVRNDWKMAYDALEYPKIKPLAQVKIMAYLIASSIISRKNILKSSTSEFEWNGELYE